MSGESDFGYKCPRCGRITTFRGGRPPRFCFVCGKALYTNAEKVPTAREPRHAPPAATAALLLAFCSFLPMIGLPLGIVSLILAGSARRQIRGSGGAFHGIGMANMATALAIAGIVISILICLRIR
jgi:hypothetical protein